MTRNSRTRFSFPSAAMCLWTIAAFFAQQLYIPTDSTYRIKGKAAEVTQTVGTSHESRGIIGKSAPVAPVASPPATCRLIAELFGSGILGTSPARIWSSNLPEILESSRIIGLDQSFHLRNRTEFILNKVSNRLHRGVKDLPRNWSTVDHLLKKIFHRSKYLKQKLKAAHESSSAEEKEPPPLITIHVMGGSVTWGQNCWTAVRAIRLSSCAWAYRLEPFLNSIAGFGGHYKRSDDSTKLVRVVNSALGGTNSAMGESILRYEVLPQDSRKFDVLINAYATNDMHVLSMNEAAASGSSLGQYVMKIQQDFARTAMSLTSSCRENKTKDKVSRQEHSPLLLFLNDYLGNEQREVMATTEVGTTMNLLATYYGFGSISYPDIVRDWVYRDTTESDFSPAGWYNSVKGPMAREIHYNNGFHTAAVFLVSYYLLTTVTTYCGMTADNGITLGGSKDSSETLLPPLSNELFLDDISEKWEDAENVRRNHQASLNTSSCSSLLTPHCSLSWMSHLSSIQSKIQIENYFSQFFPSNSSASWTVIDFDGNQPKPGWSPPYDGLGKSFVLDIPLATPTETIAFFILKSYGTKWENSTASVEIHKVAGGRIEDNMLFPVLEKKYMMGYHNKETSELYSIEFELSEVVSPPEKLKLQIRLESGHTFKLMGLAVCGGQTAKSQLPSGFPPQCKHHQRKAIMQQLPSKACFQTPYSQECSFTKATTKGCSDPHWAREIYGKTTTLRGAGVNHDGKFRAVFVDLACKRSERVADIMLMGTHDTSKYDAAKFLGGGAVGFEDCNRKKSYGSGKMLEAEAVCITPDQGAINDISVAKKTSGILDSELREVAAQVGKPDRVGSPLFKQTLDAILDKVGILGKPIHYLVIDGNDSSDVVEGATETLKHVRYMEFSVGHKGSWTSASFSNIIRKRMVENNLVCYWKGSKGNIWRITGCWFSHYHQKHWANVACVSAKHQDAKPLLDKMESTFEETLEKQLSF